MLPHLLSPFIFGSWSGSAEDSIRTKGGFSCLLGSSLLQGEGCSSLYRGGIIGFLICSCLGTVSYLRGLAGLFFSCSCVILSWVWFSVWIWWSWNPLTGHTVSKHSGHLMADSLMKEVGRTVFMSHYPLAVFRSLIKGFVDFSFLPLLLVTLRSPIKYKKKITYQNLLLQLRS